MTKDWVHGVFHTPSCQILLQIVLRAVITSSPPAWTSSAGMLSTPADFLYVSGCTAASTSLQRMGWSSSVSVWVQFITDGSPLALWLYSSEQYSVHRFSICRSSVRHFPERSWTVVTFPCFTVVKSLSLSVPFFAEPLSLGPRHGVLRMQKLKLHLLRTQLKVLLLKPGVVGI